ncbi:MAG: hypothetical protein AAF596_07550 [Planctomycetota bacterium]
MVLLLALVYSREYFSIPYTMTFVPAMLVVGLIGFVYATCNERAYGQRLRERRRDARSRRRKEKARRRDEALESLSDALGLANPTCPDCDAPLEQIELVDSNGIALCYANPEFKRGLVGLVSPSGTVVAERCSGCDRIFLRGVPFDDGDVAGQER